MSDPLKDLKDSYVLTFTSEHGEAVLADLEAKYYNRAIIILDPKKSIDVSEVMFREGCREVVRRIKNFMQEKKPIEIRRD